MISRSLCRRLIVRKTSVAHGQCPAFWQELMAALKVMGSAAQTYGGTLHYHACNSWFAFAFLLFLLILHWLRLLS